MIGLTLLGATGSVGVSTLDVVSRHKEKYEIIALTANRNVELLAEQCAAWGPKYAVIADHDQAEPLRKSLKEKGVDSEVEVLSGVEGLQFVAALPEADYIMAAIVGAAGLLPTLAAAKAGKRVLLANKESLVMSGKLFMDTIHEFGAELLPIDSEHNAIFQSMPAHFAKGLPETGVEKILLTASGGPFRETPLDEFDTVSPEQACAHPNWDMGRKISVDSATMMNKGLEVIEACWLFNTGPEKIQVVLHPQSIIHSMVQYVDGSVLAQLGNPDMRTPIAHALAWPERIDSGAASLNLFDVARLDFEIPDLERFPSLKLAREAMTTGGTSTAILNAANEIAVDAFLNRQIRFTAIPQLVETTLENVSGVEADSIETVLAADVEARQFALAYIREELV